MVTNFQKFSPTDLAANLAKLWGKRWLPYQMHRYTILWNDCAQKSQWHKAQWNRLPCKTMPFKRVAQKYSPNYVSIILFYQQDIYSDYTEKLAKWPTVHTSINQEQRHRNKMPAHTITDSISWWVISGWQNTSLTLPVKECYWGVLIITWYCYKSFCPPHIESQMSFSFFSRRVPRCTRRLRQSPFPHNFAKCWAILKILPKQTQQ